VIKEVKGKEKPFTFFIEAKKRFRLKNGCECLFCRFKKLMQIQEKFDTMIRDVILKEIRRKYARLF